jgi:hypothetical protein
VLYYQKRIPGYHLVSSLKKASKLHPGYNVYPMLLSNLNKYRLEEREKEKKRKEVSSNKAKYID